MIESLEIKDFGPIKHIHVEDIKPMTVLIGESGSGKSTIMKVLALSRWLYKMMSIRSYLKYSGVKKSPFRFRIDSLLRTVGLENYMRTSTIITYKNGEVVIRLENGNLNGTSQYIPKSQLSLEKISFIADNRNLVADIIEGKISVKKQFYLNETYEDYVKASESIRDFGVDYLGVKLEVRKTQQGLKHRIVSTENGNTLPLNLIVEYYSKKFDIVGSMNQAIFSYVTKADSLKDFKAVENVGELSHKRVHLFIEEPELSLFPESQLHLVDFITDRVISNGPEDYDISLMIATHSPYIVNYLNVLLSRKTNGAYLNGKPGVDEKQLDVYRVFEGEIQSLMTLTKEGKMRVDATDMVETMETIGNEYAELN